MSNLKKFVSVEVETPKGTKKLKFSKYTGETDGRPCRCEDVCSYASVCEIIPDPRDPRNPDVSFVDFCGELSEREEEKYLDLVPTENTIEENLGDVIPDICQQIIAKKKLTNAEEVVDCLCPGWCSNYTKDHSGCKVETKSCILHDLFMKVKKRKKPEENE